MSGSACLRILLRSKKASLSVSCRLLRLYSRLCCLPHSLGSCPKRARPSSVSSHSDPGPGIESRVWRRSSSFSSSNQGLDFRLTGTQVDGILRASQRSVRIPALHAGSPGMALHFESNQLAANVPNEDRWSAATCLQSGGTLFGVFDGHGGPACAHAISQRLPHYVALALMRREALEEMEQAAEHLRPLPPLLRWHGRHGDRRDCELPPLHAEQLRVFWQELLDVDEPEEGMGPGDALRLAFTRQDGNISLEAQAPLEDDLARSAAVQAAFAGSTACVAHVGPEGLHVANTGDSRAVLGVQEEDGSWSALPLSFDHNAQNEAEVARVRSQHPKAEEGTVLADGRLLGVLMPLRAFGDVRFKWSQELQRSVLENGCCDLESLGVYHYTPPYYHTPPYLEVTPEVTHHRLRPQDRFLILASDGLWDMLENEEAVRLVAEHLTGVHLQAAVSAVERQVNLGQMHSLLRKRRARATPSLDANAATHLVRHALGTNEYGEMDQDRLAAMLALPDDLARMYRDDITVTVVFFNSNLAQHRNA